MISRTIPYIDYNGNKREDTFYFHLSKADIWKLEIGENGALTNRIQAIANEPDQSKIWKMFEEIVGLAVGKKSADGKRFDKSPEAKADFLESEAYSEFLEMLLTGDHGKDPEFATKFLNGLTKSAEAVDIQTLQQGNIQLVN